MDFFSFSTIRSTIGLRVCFSVRITFGDGVIIWVNNNGFWHFERKELDRW